MERCSCCNARLNGAVLCPRCQSNLGGVIGSEQLAQLCLNHAMDFWFANQSQLAIQTLSVVLKLKRTTAALIFRDFIVKNQIQRVLALLMEMKIDEANQIIISLHALHPRHRLVEQLLGFTNHLIERKKPRKELIKHLQEFTDYLLAYKD